VTVSFGALKDLKIGDAIELQTADGTQLYRVTEFLIVDPTDVSVIEPTLESAVTLVTCYPFYFVGHAPQRYIVRGVID
jgi:sortase A